MRSCSDRWPSTTPNSSSRSAISDGLNFYVSYRDFQDYRARSPVLSDAIGSVPRAAVAQAGRGLRAHHPRAGHRQLFLDARRAAGGGTTRFSRTKAARPGTLRSWCCRYAYWQSRFGGDPSIIGRTIRLGGQPFTIIGVSSSAFRGTESLAACLGIRAGVDDRRLCELGLARDVRRSLACARSRVLGRLKPGVSLEQARAALDVRAGTAGARLSRDAQEHLAARGPGDACPSDSIRWEDSCASAGDSARRSRRRAGADHQRQRRQPADGAGRQPLDARSRCARRSAPDAGDSPDSF